MFSLKEAAIIVVTLTAIQAMVYGLEQTLGDAGLIIGTLLASLFEVHAAIATVVMQGPPSQQVLSVCLNFRCGWHMQLLNASMPHSLVACALHCISPLPKFCTCWRWWLFYI